MVWGRKTKNRATKIGKGEEGLVSPANASLISEWLLTRILGGPKFLAGLRKEQKYRGIKSPASQRRGGGHMRTSLTTPVAWTVAVLPFSIAFPDPGLLLCVSGKKGG